MLPLGSTLKQVQIGILYYKVFNKKPKSDPEHLVCAFRIKRIKTNIKNATVEHSISSTSFSLPGRIFFFPENLSCIISLPSHGEQLDYKPDPG